jgi:hypothetical protein
MFGKNNNLKFWNMNINSIVKKTLREKYHLNESFGKIFLNENTDVQFDETINYFGKLIDEGYDNEKIETVVTEQFEWLSKLFSNQTPTKDSSVQDKLIGAGKSGAISQFREYLIKKFLSFIGFEGPLASAIATALSEMTVADLISVFRSRESCMTHSGVVAKAVVEAMVTYIVQNNTQEDSIAYNFLRNSLSEYLANEGYMDKMGQFVCDFTYKSKGNILSKVGL